MKTSFIILFMLLSTSVYSQKTVCDQVKTGVFKLTTEISGTTIIRRNKKFQIETNKYYNYKAKFKVLWIDDCTYQLYREKFQKGPSYLKGNKKDVLTVKILSIKGKTLSVESTASYNDLKRVVDMTIIK